MILFVHIPVAYHVDCLDPLLSWKGLIQSLKSIYDNSVLALSLVRNRIVFFLSDSIATSSAAASDAAVFPIPVGAAAR